MSGGFTWKPHEITRLRTDREAGLSFAECAANLPGRTPDAIRSRLKYERSVAAGVKGEQSVARELGQGRFRDREYVDLCLRHGGFKPMPSLAELTMRRIAA
jgi:hypothetical protein